MTETDKLLEVLDMTDKPEDDMDKMYNWTPVDTWICQNVLTDGDETIAYQKGYLSRVALAFRLRDEVFGLPNGGNIWADGYLVVVKKLNPEVVKFDCSVEWWNCCAKPIHWIIAALIAKEIAKKT